MFGKMTSLLEKAKQIDYNDQMQSLFSMRDTQDKIIELNTLSQLFEQGTDATGRSLESIGGGYAESTIRDKRTKSLPFDRVTLSDTFTFYDSFEVFADLDSFAIVYNPIKNGYDLRERWGDNIAGLSNDSIRELQEYTLPILQNMMLFNLLN